MSDEKTIKEQAIEYANSIIKGDIISCRAVKWAAKRFLNDLNNEEKYYFDDKITEKFRVFCSHLRHSTGEWVSKPFVLSPYQVFFIGNVLGLKCKDTELRKYSFVYFSLARKNGKSSLFGALSLFELIASGEGDATIIMVANNLQQVQENLKICNNYAHSIDKERKYLLKRFNRIEYQVKGETKGNIFIRPSVANKLDGYNPSLALVDEMADSEQDMINVLRSGMGSRREPLMCCIGTAGLNLTSYCYSSLYVNYKQQITDNTVKDSDFVLIYEIDTEDYTNDEFITNKKIWYKANPNLGISVYENYLEREIDNVRIDYKNRTGVLTKHMNVWVDGLANASELYKYIDDNIILNRMIDIDLNDFRGKYCFVGVDLSHCADLNAVTVMIPNVNGVHYFKNFYFLPEQNTNIKDVKNKLSVWEREGYITLTEGNAMHPPSIVKCIRDLQDVYGLNVIEVHYDENNSFEFQKLMQDECSDIIMVVFKQSYLNFNLPTKEFKYLVLTEKCFIDKNSVTRWNFHNSVESETTHGNIKVTKLNKNPANKIDGVISIIQSLGGFLTSQYIREDNI